VHAVCDAAPPGDEHHRGACSNSRTASSNAKARRSAAGLDADGKPTKALEGFMRSANVTSGHSWRAWGKARRNAFVARIEQTGKALDEYLQDMVVQALKKLPVPKLMRWGDSELPVRASGTQPDRILHGKRVVKAELFWG
jgi:glycyl-tRNA synthetase beta chain